MSVQQENLKEIADAIREKTGTTELFPANTFAEKIRNIEGGGSGVGQFYYVDGLKKGEIFNDYENNIAMSDYSHSEGKKNAVDGEASHVEGYKISSLGYTSHGEGKSLISHTELETAAKANGYSDVKSFISANKEKWINDWRKL